ncbi:MAG: fermentation-respiration switch protein FrsA (DUF1100 family) [Paracoccaceae bacterium]|jgi:fermentation-respiration switch protein FrsA (DUF1100 family)
MSILKCLILFICGLVILYLGCTAYLFLFQRSLLYHPAKGVNNPADYGVGEMKVVKLETYDGLSIAAWYRAPKNKNGLTLIYFHGNTGHIGDRANKVKPYLDYGYGVLLLSYRGFGSNLGEPTETNLYLDGQAALKYVSDKGTPIFRTVIYGESLGTGVAVELAQGKEIASLVLEAPFTSMIDAAAHHYGAFPVRFILKDKFDSISKINNIKTPILILHGLLDRTVPFKFGYSLYKAAPNPKQFYDFPLAGHGDIYDYGASKKVIQFLEEHSTKTSNH